MRRIVLLTFIFLFGVAVGIVATKRPSRSAPPAAVTARTPSCVFVGNPDPSTPHGRAYRVLRPLDGPALRGYRDEWVITMLFDEPNGDRSAQELVLVP